MIEFQKITSKQTAYVPEAWSLPTIQIDRKLRDQAPYVTIVFVAGRSIAGFRIYWNVTH